MTTKDFIKKHYGVHGGVRKLSSVMVDTNGTVYSYGYHYPLVFQTVENNGLYFVNTRGYSNTTQRHILWAKEALDYDYVSVELPTHNVQFGEAYYTVDDVLLYLGKQRDKIVDQMSKKTRKNTRVYEDLSSQLAQVAQDIIKVRG